MDERMDKIRKELKRRDKKRETREDKRREQRRVIKREEKKRIRKRNCKRERSSPLHSYYSLTPRVSFPLFFLFLSPLPRFSSPSPLPFPSGSKPLFTHDRQREEGRRRQRLLTPKGRINVDNNNNNVR